MAKSMKNRPVASRSFTKRVSGLARLLAGVSTGAAGLALAFGPLPAHAQAVIGTPTGQFGISGVNRDGATSTDTVFVNSTEALLDWTSTDAGGVFLPNGATLNFRSAMDSSDSYTVLNRVTSAAAGGPLSIAGAVNSDSQGRVWFYNPGGWVVGSTGVFNVGSLVLTSLPISVDLSADPPSRLYGSNGEIRFGAATSATSSVSVASGAQINATLGSSSYVALVAPRVSQGGTVTVDGSTAYIAAEAATLTINNGLFDIVVDSGSSDSVGVEHTGQTTGPAGTLGDPNHRIHIVAVPKNQAMTAMIAGSLGYAAATSASEQDGSIVLSAGYNVAGGSAVDGDPAGGNASIAISGIDAGNRLSAKASGGINVDARTANAAFASDASFTARGDIGVSVAAGHSLTVGGTLDILSTAGSVGGNVSIVASNGGTFDVSGDFNASSIGSGAIRFDPMNGDTLEAGSMGDAASSGDVTVALDDASFRVGGTMYLRSQATGGVGELSAGSATAGNVGFSAVLNNPDTPLRTVTVGGTAYLQSHAFDAADYAPTSPITGASSSSGNASFAVNGGLLSLGGIYAESLADASSGTDAAVQAAAAGGVSVSVSNLADTLSTGSIYAANYGYAENGGAVTMGDVGVTLDAADVTIGANQYGYLGLNSYSSGELTGANTLTLDVLNDSRLYLPNSSVSIYAYGRDALVTQYGANIGLTVDNSVIDATGVYANTSAYGRGSGVNSIGGDITVNLRNDAFVTTLYDVSFNSLGTGGSGTDSGDGTGGDVSFLVADSSLMVGTLRITSQGASGSRNDAAGHSGTGYGGLAMFRQTGSQAYTSIDAFVINSFGTGGYGEGYGSGGSQVGNGAAGIGGAANFIVDGGLVSANSIQAFADGFGGSGRGVSGGDPVKGGMGTGGSASFQINDGATTIGNIEVSASGYGGYGGSHSSYDLAEAGNGGDGLGGMVAMGINGGILNTFSISIAANGNRSYDDGYGYTTYYGLGGDVYYDTGAAGAGGNGQGGNALLTVDGGALLNALPQSGIDLSIAIEAIGEGGQGGSVYSYSSDIVAAGSGGDGLGGIAGLSFLSGTLEATQISVDASGLGGPAGDIYTNLGARGAVQASVGNVAGSGGSGVGGEATLRLAADFDPNVLQASRVIGLYADGIGRDGGSADTGGSGGNGTGGSVAVEVEAGATNLVGITLSAYGFGGHGGESALGADGGAGGDGAGGMALLSVIGEGASLGASGTLFDISGTGGDGGNGGSGGDTVDQVGNGGAGGAGTGGSIALAAASYGTLSIFGGNAGNQLAAIGTGGAGGLGGNASLSGGIARGNGGAGGAAVGGAISGTADQGGALQLDAFTLVADARGGAGGGRLEDGGNGTSAASSGGAGGDATGGSITLAAMGAGAMLTADKLTLSASATGGNAADALGANLADGSGVAGAAGGFGIGGTIQILAQGSATLAFDAPDDEISLTIRGTGGNGGAGSAALAGTGANGGAGGDGGLGQGGHVMIAANTLGIAGLAQTDFVTITATGYGGLGGAGGAGASNQAVGGIGGNGGASGIHAAGVGGTVDLSAGGGDLTFGGLTVFANGYTPFASVGGSAGSGAQGSGVAGASGYFTPSGGSISITSSDSESGDGGSLVAAATTLEATGTVTFPSFNIAGAAGAAVIVNRSSRSSDGLRFGSLAVDTTGLAADGSGIMLSAINGPITIDGDLQLAAAGLISLAMNPQASIVAGGIARLYSGSTISISGTGNGQFTGSFVNLFADDSLELTGVECAGGVCETVRSDNALTAYAGSGIDLAGGARLTAVGSVDVYSNGSVTGDPGSGFTGNGTVQVGARGDVTVRNIAGRNVYVTAGAIFDGDPYYYPALLTVGEADGGGTISAVQDLYLTSGGGIDVTAGNRITAGAGIEFASGNDIVVGGNNVITAGGVNPDGFSNVVFAAGGLDLSYTLDSGDIATLTFDAGTTVDSGRGGVVLSAAAIDARSAAFSGAFFEANVTRALLLADMRGDDGGTLDPLCLEGGICLGDVAVTGNIDVGTGQSRPVDVRGEGTLQGRTVRIASLGNITLADGAVVRGGTVALTGGGSLLGAGQISASIDDIGLTFGADINAASIAAARQLTTAALVGGAAEAAFTTPGSMQVGQLTLGTSANISTGAGLAIGELSLGGGSAALSAGTTLALTTTTGVDDLTLSGSSAQLGALAIGGDLTVSAGSVTGTSATTGGFVTINSGGSINLSAITAGTNLSITARDLAVPALQSGGNLVLRITNVADLGTVASGGIVDIDPILLTFDSITSVGDTILAGDTITGGSIDAGGAVDVTAGNFTFTTIKAGNGFSTSNTSMAGTSVAASGAVTISSSGGVGLEALSGTSVAINSGGAVNIAELQASGLVSVSADAVSVVSSGALSIRTISAFDGNIEVVTAGLLSGGSFAAVGDVTLRSTGNSVIVDGISAGYDNRNSTAVQAQAVTAGVVGQGDILIDAAQDIELNGTADAANAFIANAGGTIRLNALATGKTMSLSSADLAIGSGGQLGQSTHTDVIDLFSTSLGVTLLGDNVTAQGAGYTLSQAEFGRIQSRGGFALRGAAPLVIGDLAITAQSGSTAGQVGETGTLLLESDGLASIVGTVTMANAAGNTLAINGDDGIYLDATTGSIRLLDGQNRAGTLRLTGAGIAMVTRSALDAIAGTNSTAAITDRLGQNDGVTDGRTLVEADVIRLTSEREVYIQNTAAGTDFAQRRGFVANSLSIGSADGTTHDVVINGVIGNAAGIDVIALIDFEDDLTSLSSVNGCVIANVASCTGVVEPEQPEIPDITSVGVEVRDLIEEQLQDSPEDASLQIADGFTRTTLIQLNQIAPAEFEPLIDEPVTGTGNDDLLGDDGE